MPVYNEMDLEQWCKVWAEAVRAALRLDTLFFSGFNGATQGWRVLSLHSDSSHTAWDPIRQPALSCQVRSYIGTQRLVSPNSQSTGFLPLLFTMLSYTWPYCTLLVSLWGFDASIWWDGFRTVMKSLGWGFQGGPSGLGCWCDSPRSSNSEGGFLV